MDNKKDYSLPSNVTSHTHTNGFELRRHWRKWHSFSFPVFAVLWLGFFVRDDKQMFSQMPYVENLYILSLAVGVAIFYFGLTQLFNYSSVRVFSQSLKVSHGPFPLLLGRTIERKQIQQFYVNQHYRRNENGTVITFELRLQCHDGKDICLLKNIDEKLSAKYIEQELEHYLQIKNMAVKGEVSN